MTINTKFDLNQMVYLIVDHAPKTGMVEHINVKVSAFGTETFYKVGGLEKWLKENQIAASMEELIKNITSTSVESVDDDMPF